MTLSGTDGAPVGPDELVTIVGAGVMGSQIAQSVAAAGVPVRLHDAEPAALTRASERIVDGAFGLRAAVVKGLIAESDAEAIEARISGTTDLEEAVAGATVVVEAVPEDLALKMRVMKAVDRVVSDRCVITSNTAGLPITALAHATERPERVLGWHWAQPVAAMKLAEIVVHGDVDDRCVRAVTDLARLCGKHPQVVRDQPMAWGFVANRINAAVLREAAAVVEEGVATEDQVDAIMKDCFRWPMGPFEVQRPGSLG